MVPGSPRRALATFALLLLGGCNLFTESDDSPLGGGGAAGGSGSGAATLTVSGTGTPGCGDGQCVSAETCADCASDCGPCSGCTGASAATTGLDAEEQALLGLLGAYREENGLAPLLPCTSLSRAAQGHAEAMRDGDFLDHMGADGSSFVERACAACFEHACGPSTIMGENLAAGSPYAKATLEQWKASPDHDANIRSESYVVVGIGRATGGGSLGVYWTNVFAGAGEPSCN